MCTLGLVILQNISLHNHLPYRNEGKGYREQVDDTDIHTSTNEEFHSNMSFTK